LACVEGGDNLSKLQHEFQGTVAPVVNVLQQGTNNLSFREPIVDGILAFIKVNYTFFFSIRQGNSYKNYY